MKPLIGITGRQDQSARLHSTALYAVGQTYVRAIQKVGGVPLIIPPTMTADDCSCVLAALDGLLLTGGEDIVPKYYEQMPEAWLGGVDEKRDISELGLVQQWLTLKRPLLAICRGHQMLNIATGGTLYQDIAAHIPNALDHPYTPARPMEQLVHWVEIAPDSQLARIFGATSLEVNSAHHQAVKTPGAGIKISAHAPDGVVEALELSAHPFCVSVQWHPEAMVKVNDSMWPLFKAFVKSAENRVMKNIPIQTETNG